MAGFTNLRVARYPECLESIHINRLIRIKLFHRRSFDSTGYQKWPNVLRREEIVVCLHVVKRVSSFHRASSDLRDMETANPSLTQEWNPSLRPAPTSHATEPYRTDKSGQRGTAANERWRKNCFSIQSPCEILSNRIIFAGGFHAGAPIYIAVAKTRIPAAHVTCEHICGST